MLIDEPCWQILNSLTGGEMNISELLRDFRGSGTTLDGRLNWLIKNGFVSENKLRKWPFTRKLRLTDKGRQVFEGLERVRMFIGFERRRKAFEHRVKKERIRELKRRG